MSFFEFRGFEKIPNLPNWACVFLQSAFLFSCCFLLFWPPCSLQLPSLFSSPLPSVSPPSPTATPAVGTEMEGAGRRPGYLHVKPLFLTDFTGATQVTRLLWKPPHSSPPLVAPLLAFPKRPVSSGTWGTSYSSPTFGAICLPPVLCKLLTHLFDAHTPLRTHMFCNPFYSGGCYWISYHSKWAGRGPGENYQESLTWNRQRGCTVFSSFAHYQQKALCQKEVPKSSWK